MVKVGLGQDSHAFESVDSTKKLVLGGVCFEKEIGLKGNSDADVILHALTNAISGITTKPVLGKRADELIKQGMNDSIFFLEEALKDLEKIAFKIEHISISMECLKPKIMPLYSQIQSNIARFCKVDVNAVGLTATTGEGLSSFGKGFGIFCSCIVTAKKIGE